MIPIPLNTAGRVGLGVLLCLAGIVGLYFGEPVVVPVLISLLCACVLGPGAVWLHRNFKMPWSLSCIAVIFALLAVNFLIIAVFSASVTRLVNRFSNEEEVLKIYKKFREKVANIGFDLDKDHDLLPDDPASFKDIGVLQYLRDATPSIITQLA